MKTVILAALAAAALTVSLTLTINAQSLPQKSNQHTKVYGYKKQLPEANPSYPGMASQRPVSTPAYHPNPLPYGSQEWWNEMGRGSHGDGGQ